MTREIVVTTGARLHFGLLAHGAGRRRQFGGIGVMIDEPGFLIRATSAPATELECGPWRGRVEALCARLASGLAVAGSLRIEVLRSPPPHAGLGSGTQLAMALAKIASVFEGERDAGAARLALRAARGLRSAVGLYGFELGGLIVEAGKRLPEEISPLVARVEFPREWRFVLARPRGASGTSGTEESNHFARLAPMSGALTDRLCAIALTEIVPATIEGDFVQASDAIGAFGRLVGGYFAPAQGGVFADERIRVLAELVQRRGITGAGQTSWGPTLFILCPSQAFATDLAAELSAERIGAECEFTIAAPLNQGATVVER